LQLLDVGIVARLIRLDVRNRIVSN